MTPEQFSRLLAARIRRARLDAGWSQVRLANELLISPAALCHREKGHTEFKPWELVQIGTALDIDAGSLLALPEQETSGHE